MKNTFFVICGNLQEFEYYIRNKDSDSRDYRYVFSRSTLLGYINPHGCFCGSWRQREDIHEILMELIVRTTTDNGNLKKLLSDISKVLDN